MIMISNCQNSEKWVLVIPRLARTWSRSCSVSRIFCCCCASFSSYCIFITFFSRSLRFNCATMFSIDAMSVVRFAKVLSANSTSHHVIFQDTAAYSRSRPAAYRTIFDKHKCCQKRLDQLSTPCCRHLKYMQQNLLNMLSTHHNIRWRIHWWNQQWPYSVHSSVFWTVANNK